MPRDLDKLNHQEAMASTMSKEMAAAAEGHTSAIKALRNLIRMQEVEIGCLESIEERYHGVLEEFVRFSDLAKKQDSTARETELRFEREGAKHKKANDDLRSQISLLKSAIEDQRGENEKLERELKDSVETFQKLQFSNDRCMNSCLDHKVSEMDTSMSSPYIHRLHNDYQ